ncbi:MAG TPA: VOC family protein [Candidatus Acidoferrum sp.]|jgi:glyoxylase I family protein|nr:VOC family protein [Candidatus Acidoferrum sp.]
MALDIRGLAPLLQVFDMAASIHFYRDILGSEVVNTWRPGAQFDWALLRLSGVELMLNTAYESDERPCIPDANRTAAHDDTGLYFGCPDVEGAYNHLRAKGLDIKQPVIRPYGMKQLNIADPDGYNLCFQWPA